MANLWDYSIYKQEGNGCKVFIAEYISETTPKNVTEDLRLEHSRLQNYLQFQGVDAADYRKNFNLRNEALLGGLKAKSVCSRTFGVRLPLEAPAAKSIGQLPKGAKLVSTEDGVRVWQIRAADMSCQGQ
jgi:hypothetical protein